MHFRCIGMTVLFTGQSNTTANFNFDGVFTRINKEPLPNGLTGLLNTGRSLCASKFPGLGFEQHSWTAKGVISGKQILNATGLVDALLAIKQGVVIDQSLDHELRIEHEIIDSKPVSCKVSIVDADRRTEMKMLYRQTKDPGKLRAVLKNAWGSSRS